MYGGRMEEALGDFKIFFETRTHGLIYHHSWVRQVEVYLGLLKSIRSVY